MDPGAVYGAGISFPPRVGADGRVSWSRGEPSVRDAIQLILLTNLGERVMLPDFGGGLRQFLFEPNTTTTRQLIRDRITRALGRWEPRISLEAVDVEADPDDGRVAIATITYRLVATQERETTSLAVTLSG
jgi:phage baseplate assembly protein W